MSNTALRLYALGWSVAFLFLKFLDGYQYTWLDWLIVIPINAFLSTIWPI